MGLLDQILIQGDDSVLRQELVKKRAYVGEVSGGINLLGNMYDYYGPMLEMGYVFHDQNIKPEQIMAAVDEAVAPLREKPVSQAVLDRALVKLRSDFYDQMASLNGFGRVDILAALALFDDDPNGINQLEGNFRKVTPELLQKTAQKYLAPENRTVLVIAAGKSNNAAKSGE